MNRYFLVFPVFFSLILAGCQGSPSPQESGDRSVQRASDFALNSPSGASVHLQSFEKKVVLLDFWSVYCGPCEMTAPVLERLYGKYRESGFAVIGVNTDEPGAPVKDFVARHKISYPVALDIEGNVHRRYGVRGLPAMILLDKKGNIRRNWIGYDYSLDEIMESSIKALLQEPS